MVCLSVHILQLFEVVFRYMMIPVVYDDITYGVRGLRVREQVRMTGECRTKHICPSEARTHDLPIVLLTVGRCNQLSHGALKDRGLDVTQTRRHRLFVKT